MMTFFHRNIDTLKECKAQIDRLKDVAPGKKSDFDKLQRDVFHKLSESRKEWESVMEDINQLKKLEEQYSRDYSAAVEKLDYLFSHNFYGYSKDVGHVNTILSNAIQHMIEGAGKIKTVGDKIVKEAKHMK